MVKSNFIKGFIELPTNDPNKTRRVKLSNDDKVFEEIRTMHVSEVFSHLKSVVAEMKNVHEVKFNLI